MVAAAVADLPPVCFEFLSRLRAFFRCATVVLRILHHLRNSRRGCGAVGQRGTISSARSRLKRDVESK